VHLRQLVCQQVVAVAVVQAPVEHKALQQGLVMAVLDILGL
jgi:hypothetical protein